MEFNRLIQTIDLHTMGEPTRVVVTPLFNIYGQGIAEKRARFQREMDFIRTSLMHEPRGHKDMFGAILTPPESEGSHFGVIFMDGKGYLDMCIHGSMGAVRAVLETGIVPMIEPVTTLKIDSPAGKINAEVELVNGRVKSITIENVPSFLFQQDLKVELPGVGNVLIDIAFGGNFFAMVNAKDLGIELDNRNLSRLIKAALTIREKVNEALTIQHPIEKHINQVNLVVIHDDPKNPKAHRRNITIFGSGQYDRSPCGTGTSSMMAALYKKGKLKLGQRFLNESIIGTLFEGRLDRSVMIGGFEAVVPKITGNSYIIGTNQWIIDPDDPLKYGFSLE